MGITCSSEAADSTSRAIDRQLERERIKNLDEKKLLLLGTGECGKSTILKQVRILHDEQWGKEDLDLDKRRIYSNILEGAKALYEGSVEQTIFLSHDAEEGGHLIKRLLDTRREVSKLTPELVHALKALWEDEGIRLVYDDRNALQIADSIAHFMDSIDRISQPDYVPTNEDYLHLRIPTTGIIEMRLTIKNNHFVFIDVGGQRSERKKWIHTFDEVTAVLFISAVSEYDQVLEENRTDNRLRESLRLYESIVQSPAFFRTPIIIFLNKVDIFEEKILTIPITNDFPEYKGPHTAEESLKFIERKFISKSADNRPYIHRTCATKTNQVQLAINSVIDAVIREALAKMGIE